MLIGPFDEVFDIRSVRVSSIVLSPSQLTAQQSHIHIGHALALVIIGGPKILSAQQTKHGPGSDGGHEAALLIEPFGISLLGNSIANESEPRSTQGNQLL